MKIKVSEIKKIIAEEFKRIDESEELDEAVPFKGVAASPSGRGRRPRQIRGGAVDPTDAPDPGRIAAPDAQIGSAVGDARNALAQAMKAVAAFNPRWHRWVCRTPQGQEMSDIVINLERGLKSLHRELMSVSEARVLDVDSLRALVAEEVEKADKLDELGIFKMKFPSTRNRRPRSVRRTAPETAPPTSDLPKASPAISKVRTMISDFVHLYDTFTPKMRRKMCLGQAGDNLVQRLQTLDDMLGKL